MTWRRWLGARQLLAEEGVGVNVRAAKHAEDAKFKRSAQNLQRMKGA